MGKLKSISQLGWLGGFFALISSGAFAQIPASATPAAAQNSSEPTIQPSRYVGDKFEEYIATLSASLSIETRERDPFGALQDPDAKPAIIRPRQTIVAEPQVPFASIISQVQINTVMAGEKRFLVGSRSIAQGDQFPLNYQGKMIRILVTEVSARQVEFKNLETGEIAAHRLNILPAGMTPGQQGISAPGMTPAGPNAPLEILPNPSQPGAIPNR